MLDEYESKRLLSAYGIPVVETRVARSSEEACAAARELGFPVVVKLYSATITHKTDVGGVVLDIDHPDALRAALADIPRRLAQHQPGARIAGYTVQQMVRRPRAVELIVGISTDITARIMARYEERLAAYQSVDFDDLIGLPLKLLEGLLFTSSTVALVVGLGYFLREDIPFQFALANAFTICDAYHCSFQGNTNPNRLFMFTGTNDPFGEGDAAPRGPGV